MQHPPSPWGYIPICEIKGFCCQCHLGNRQSQTNWFSSSVLPLLDNMLRCLLLNSRPETMYGSISLVFQSSAALLCHSDTKMTGIKWHSFCTFGLICSHAMQCLLLHCFVMSTGHIFIEERSYLRHIFVVGQVFPLSPVWGNKLISNPSSNCTSLNRK